MTNRPYRLPTEAEWEKAARGDRGNKYSWGEAWNAAYCNANTAGTTSVVSADNLKEPTFPEGRSPYGCYDMIGNVWEWTSTLWGSNPLESDFPYPYEALDGREVVDPDQINPFDFRVYRGGSFEDDIIYLTGTARRYASAKSSSYKVGFRIAVGLD